MWALLLLNLNHLSRKICTVETVGYYGFAFFSKATLHFHYLLIALLKDVGHFL